MTAYTSLRLIGPAGILFLVPISLLVTLAVVQVNAMTPLIAIVHAVVTVDAFKEWWRRRAHPEKQYDGLWFLSRLLLLICCSGLGWLLIHALRRIPGDRGRLLLGTYLLGLPLSALVIFFYRLRQYRRKRREFAETAPRIHIDLAAFDRAAEERCRREHDEHLNRPSLPDRSIGA